MAHGYPAGAAPRDDEAGRVRALQRMEVLDTPPEAPFEKIVDLVRQVLRVPMSAVSLVDAERQWLKARRGDLDVDIERSITFCTHAIQSPTPLVVADAHSDHRFRDNPLVRGAPFIRSYAGAPLTTSEGYALGSLCAIDTRPRQFSAEDLQVLTRFAEVVVEELELRQLAALDALTGVLARRAWLEAAGAELASARRTGRPLCLAIIDIDHFKQVNDRFGHAAGDAVIQALADACRRESRASDRCGRLGGEEFGLLLPEASLEEAGRVLDRVWAAFGAQETRHGEHAIRATFSAGLAEFNGDQDLDALMELADRGLYAAKGAGRNRVHRAPAG